MREQCGAGRGDVQGEKAMERIHEGERNMKGARRSTPATDSNTECRGREVHEGDSWKTPALSWSA